MRKVGALVAAGLASVIVSGLGTSASAGGSGSGSSSAGLADSPPADGARHLVDVSALSASDAWAVGRQGVGGATRDLVQHWDGHTWTDVTIADPGPGEVSLSAVAAISPTDVWVVGETDELPPLVEHWDGEAWHIVDPPENQSSLAAVAGSAPNDVWAAGYTSGGGSLGVGHWNGARWVDTPLERPGGFSAWVPQAITALSAKDAWIVGTYVSGGESIAFAEHWDGARWKLLPSLSLSGARPYAVSATGRNDVWLVGIIYRKIGMTSPMTAHWHGHRWTTEAWPIEFREYGLFAVTAIAPNDVWAVGHDERHVLAKHWNGRKWTDDPKADPSRRHLAAGLYGLDAVDSHHVFAVGKLTNDDVEGAFTEAWNGRYWHRQRQPS